MKEHWDTSAELYSIESERISFYQITNRELIAAGQIQPGMTLVDLSCGAGLTTRTILASIGDRCTIYAVDIAEKMLYQAKKAITSKSVHFIHASADSFSRYISEGVDRVFCNAAFWHYSDASAVLKEIHAVLKTTGRFLFNIPDQEFDFDDGKQSEMSQVVSACLQQPQREGVSEVLRYSYTMIQSLATENGFSITDYKIIGIDLRPEDLIRFYSIPHIGARRFPGRSPEERREIFTKAFSVLSPAQFPRYRWAQFTLAPSKAAMDELQAIIKFLENETKV